MAWVVVGSEEIDGLNVALNEATWTDVRVDVAGCQVDFALHVLALPAAEELRAAEQVIVSLGQVRRIAASYRHGRWDDLDAAVERGRQAAVEDLQEDSSPAVGLNGPSTVTTCITLC